MSWQVGNQDQFYRALGARADRSCVMTCVGPFWGAPPRAPGPFEAERLPRIDADGCNPDSKPLEVLRILHAARDVAAVLEDSDDDV